MKKTVILLALLGVMAGASGSYAQTVKGKAEELLHARSAIAFRLALRELWQYQVTWTRSYVVSVLSGLEDVAVVEDKLIKNQEKIGDAIKPYYGGDAGYLLAGLFG